MEVSTLLTAPGSEKPRRRIPAGLSAQAVEVSAYPDRYGNYLPRHRRSSIPLGQWPRGAAGRAVNAVEWLTGHGAAGVNSLLGVSSTL